VCTLLEKKQHRSSGKNIGANSERKKKNKHMYQCNLSYPATVKAINFLLEKGMMEKRSPLYYTTSKGLEFLMKFRELEQLLKVENIKGDANLKK